LSFGRERAVVGEYDHIVGIPAVENGGTERFLEDLLADDRNSDAQVKPLSFRHNIAPFYFWYRFPLSVRH
jgi:hypothetical protein